jgi:hypothetical protein
MPKRSKIVSGKVIAAVEQSRSATKTVEASAVAVPVAETSATPETSVPVGDVKSRFQSRKEELEANRHANDPVNVRRAEKRRAAEEKKKKKHQQKRLVDKDGKDSSDKNSGVDANDGKRLKSGKESIEEGNFVFNRLAESGEQVASTSGGKKTISDPKQALQKLQAQKDKLEKLRATDAQKAAALEEKLEIKKALQKAEGVSVKDDVNLLKKTIARREKEKAKSRDSWTKKKTEQKESEEKRQNKRNENIQSRIDAKKNKKMGIKVKKPQKPGKQQKGKFNKKK